MNHSTTKWEALTMVYAVKKFWHFLLGNKFQFPFDHHALIHKVTQPIVLGCIVCWIMLMMEFQFEVIYTLGKQQVIANYLLRMNQTNPMIVDFIRISEWLCSYLITITTTNHQIKKLRSYLITCIVPPIYIDSCKNSFIKSIISLTVIDGVLSCQTPTRSKVTKIHVTVWIETRSRKTS